MNKLLNLISFYIFAFSQFCYGFESIDYRKISADSVSKMFPTSESDIKNLAGEAIAQTKNRIDAIDSVPTNERNFDNTIRAMDTARYYYAVSKTILHVVAMTNPDLSIKDSARKEVAELEKKTNDFFNANQKLYRVCKEYADTADRQKLSQEEFSFLKLTMKSFAVLDQNIEQQDVINSLNKELSTLYLEFIKHIQDEKRSIAFQKADLEGLDEECLNQLEKTEEGAYKLIIGSATASLVSKYCTIEQTRKKVWQETNQRAYPQNIDTLKKVIKKRDELAKFSGFSNYADLTLINQMAEKTERVKSFLDGLLMPAQAKRREELKEIMCDFPNFVRLSSRGKFYPWDIPYIQAQYEKRKFDLNDQEIAQYFAAEQTLNELLNIYSTFFNIEFKEISPSVLWEKEVKILQVSEKETNKVSGYILLDIYDRSGKDPRTCQIMIVPGIKQSDIQYPAISLVFASFPKSTTLQPSLLTHQKARDFFHEFGHALHTVLGATQFNGTSGTRVMTDFVELPSQMMEQWLWDRDILKQLSKHYKTGERIPEYLLDRLVDRKNHDTGEYILGQIFLSRLALAYFTSGPDPDIHQLTKNIYESVYNDREFDENYHYETQFWHLINYGASYYGYIWSKVFALDLFYHIKEHGLLNPEIGMKYVQSVIGRGGSADPNELLRDFLGREPNSEAFFKDLGL